MPSRRQVKALVAIRDLLHNLVEELDAWEPEALPGPACGSTWLQFSPLEEAIVKALADGTTRPGKDIAPLVNFAYGPVIQGVLANLVERKVLLSGRAGYALNTPGASS